MAEINEKFELETRADQIHFHTRTNGDRIFIKDIRLSQKQATNLAWLVNADDTAVLLIEIKVKGT